MTTKSSPELVARRLRETAFVVRNLTLDADALEAELTARDEAFPSGPTGRVSQVNGLYRTNWFDGRFLTADAFRADVIYADTRARMVAQVYPPGLAWGLTLSPLDPVSPMPIGQAGSRPPLPPGGRPEHLDQYLALCAQIAQGGVTEEIAQMLVRLKLEVEPFVAWCQWTPASGMPLGTRMQLDPGLAFDDLGRPISVGAAFTFTFTDLVQRYRTRPTVVRGGGTTFAPCACLEVLPPESLPPGAALPEGPYLLLIAPIEAGEGNARVVANPCASGSDDGTCTVAGWRGGFELSLSRLPVTAPVQAWSGAWDLRGLLSGWYFDVYEHDLRSRWNRTGASAPTFPLGPAMWRGPGPHARVEAAVPLALVYLGPDGTVWFVDPWIPRRPLAATGAAAWAANVRGAPTPAARLARVHQFQTMLRESLLVSPHGPNADGGYGPNLYQRGFRHIPPWGYLPVREPPAPSRENGLLTSDAAALAQARADAAAYFAGTNVIVVNAVALHDDDVLEDIARADEKDPLFLRQRSPTHRQADVLACMIKQRDPKSAGALQLALLALLEALLRQWGDVTTDQLVNREIEVVKVIVPLEPRRRELAVVGRTPADPLAGVFSAWTNAPAPNADLRSFPRRFVVYVKHRLVLLDALYLVLDAALDLLEIIARTYPEQIAACQQSDDPRFKVAADAFRPTRQRMSATPPPSMATLREVAAPLRESAGTTLEPLLADPVVRRTAQTSLGATFPELKLSGTWAAFDRARATAGRDAALDALTDEHAGFGLLKAAALLLPDTATDALLADLAAAAPQAPAATVATETFHKEGYVREPAVRDLANALRDAYAEKPLAELTPQAGAPVADLLVADVLAGTAREARERLGIAVGGAAVETIGRDAAKLASLAPKLASNSALKSRKFYEALANERASAGGDLKIALDRIGRGSSPHKGGAAELAKVAEILGPVGTQALVARLEKLATED